LKNSLLILILVFAQAKLFASHIIGGEIYYDDLGGNDYRVTVKLYRDCNSTTPYDTDLPMTVFDGTGVMIYEFLIPMPTPVLLDVVFNNACVSIPPGICVEEAVYEKVVTLPASATGYTLAYQKCCRTGGTQNLVSPGDQGITLTIDIPPPADAITNSSPRFVNYPPLLLCANQELVFDHSATDPDGDLLVYELCNPLQGGGTTLFPPNCGTCPSPIPALPPPYASVNWIPGIGPTNPFGSGSISVNSTTGMLNAIPDVPGFFAVGVCVKEYRAGVLLSTNIRDFIFQVLNCNVLLDAQITPQVDMPGFQSYCDGLTITFDNASFNGTDYVWDFGVAGTTADASTLFEPTYTFPAPGVYDVMLVVNPSGAPCTDTSIEQFIVYEDIVPIFTPPAPQCITSNSFAFDGQGSYPPVGTTFQWEFGLTTNPDSALTEDVSNVVFTDHGYMPVTFTIFYDVCAESYTDSVLVYAEPSIGFVLEDGLKCAPYTAVFDDTSYATTPIFYAWNFGDGTDLSDAAEPSHVYTAPGTYDVTLTIWTTSGCIDTLTLSEPDLIEVFPSPTSSFTVNPPQATVFYPNFYFQDYSEDGVQQTYHFTDGATSTEPNVWHSYVESGYHYPYQVVLNEYGCPDTSWQQVYVIPFTTIFVPNAFTPGGNDKNEIWKPVVYDTETYEIWVFDRWGQTILNSTSEEAYWDGYIDGKPAPVGVYVYLIKYTDQLTGLPAEIRGHFTLIR
jgi:gliding motility-associated-like protein